jgi:hypothetical protein
MGNAHAMNPCNTTTFPGDFIYKSDKLAKYGITLDKYSFEDGKPPFLITGKCPDGWYVEREGQYHITYYDAEDTPRIYCFVKMADYDRSAFSTFYSEERISEMKKEKEEKIKKQEMYDNFISENFASEWSEENKYIVYYFESGYHHACSYMSGYPKDEHFWNTVVEFSQHKLVGFTDNPDLSKFVEFIKENKMQSITRFSTICSRKLENGIKDLHRFEMKRMFNIDPSCKDGKYISGLHEVPYKNTLKGRLKFELY